MQKFTIIYNCVWRSGSHTHTITKMQRLLAPDMQAVVRSQFKDSMQFAFYGWPLMEGEETENGYNLLVVELHDEPSQPKFKNRLT